MHPSLLFILCLFLSLLSRAQDSVSVLFIGNSYTYVNDLPNTTRLLAESMGKQLTVGMKANGGYTLLNQSQDPATYSAMHAENWDVVVLQAQSQEPAFPVDQVNNQTLPYAEILADSLYAMHPCSNLMYFLTWGYVDGDAQWDSINTYSKMSQRLYDAYLRIADSTDAMVSPVGAAWRYVRSNYPFIDLYAADGSHPSEAGTYLAAYTFYTAIFRESCFGASYYGNLDANTATALQAAAHLTVLDSIDTFRIHPVTEPVQADFNYAFNGGDAEFHYSGVRADIWQWDLGDGSFSTLENPVHAYSPGQYQVTLIASNSCASDTSMQLITVGSLSVEEHSLNIQETNNGFEFPQTVQYFIYDDAGRMVKSGKDKYAEKCVNSGILLVETGGKFLSRRFGRISY